MLCLAAGDVVGGASAEGYSAATQQAVVVAYHLIRHGEVNREALADEMTELDGDDEAPSVFRSPSPELRQWLHSHRAGEPVYATEPSLDPVVRVAPVGMWYRRRPDDLVDAALETARLTHLDASTAVMAAAAAGAVAAGCFAQSGRDMLMAVLDVAMQAADRIGVEEFRFSHTDQMVEVTDRFRQAGSMVGESTKSLVSSLGDDPIGMAVAGIALAAPAERADQHHRGSCRGGEQPSGCPGWFYHRSQGGSPGLALVDPQRHLVRGHGPTFDRRESRPGRPTGSVRGRAASHLHRRSPDLIELPQADDDDGCTCHEHDQRSQRPLSGQTQAVDDHGPDQRAEDGGEPAHNGIEAVHLAQ